MSIIRSILLIAAIVASAPAGAQIVLTDSTPALVTFDGFAGTGFAPLPAPGQLDSDEIIVRGLSDGDQTWGGTFTSGDHARGTTTGGVATGGIYAGSDGDEFLMLQPTSSDVTPGEIVLRFTNSTGGTITALGIKYDVLVLNDQPRANSLNCGFSTDDSTYTGIGPLATTTPEAASGSPTWTRTAMPGAVPYVLVTSIPHGTDFFVRWFTDDVSGGGSRDEIGIDNIEITAETYPVELQMLTVD